ncbi:HAD family hydrolase [Bacillus luteolus]|uniref:HAD family hydrolase n=1 Tax=Litchfieldia luteola TaxID=682179 RepID=A0ABR9QHJ9_9BACI|nr:HAD family hydrolase [Cytobacillus luteolus]MBE4907970.1 HAD family hydrolase [Cytobacillus luteolus]MBP1942750.1 FMN phosphatase YigB (HAD superfamily) [Cytobacillus luteolus]
MKWEIICFDLDNTIINYEKTFERTMTYCLALLLAENKSQQEISITQWFTIFKKYCDLYWPAYSQKAMSRQEYRRARFISSMEELGIRTTIHQADRLQELFHKHVAQFVVPFKGIETMLEWLKLSGKKLGIITNGNSEIQYNKLKKAGLYPFFESIIISDAVKVAKPSAQIFDIAKERLGTKNDRCVYVGDSWELDVEGATNAKWDAIYFNTRNEKPVMQKGTSIEVRSVSELSNLLLK